MIRPAKADDVARIAELLYQIHAEARGIPFLRTLRA